jgi:hypothetical protein
MRICSRMESYSSQAHRSLKPSLNVTWASPEMTVQSCSKSRKRNSPPQPWASCKPPAFGSINCWPLHNFPFDQSIAAAILKVTLRIPSSSNKIHVLKRITEGGQCSRCPRATTFYLPKPGSNANRELIEDITEKMGSRPVNEDVSVLL